MKIIVEKNEGSQNNAKRKTKIKLCSFVIFVFMLINRNFIIYIIQRDRCKGCAARATPLFACSHVTHVTQKKVCNTFTRPLLKVSAHTGHKRSTLPSNISSVSFHLHRQSSGRNENFSSDTKRRAPYGLPS